MTERSFPFWGVPKEVWAQLGTTHTLGLVDECMWHMQSGPWKVTSSSKADFTLPCVVTTIWLVDLAGWHRWVYSPAVVSMDTILFQGQIRSIYRQNTESLHQSNISLLGQDMCIKNLFVVRKWGNCLSDHQLESVQVAKAFILDLLNRIGIPSLKCSLVMKLQNSHWVHQEVNGTVLSMNANYNLLKFIYLKGMPCVEPHNMDLIFFDAMCNRVLILNPPKQWLTVLY